MESGVDRVVSDTLPNGFPSGQIADTAAQLSLDFQGHKSAAMRFKQFVL